MTLPPFTLTPVDILLPLLWLFVVVVSAQRGLVGLIAGLTGAVLLKPFLLLATYSAPLALVVALLVGFLVTLLVRAFSRAELPPTPLGLPLGGARGARFSAPRSC